MLNLRFGGGEDRAMPADDVPIEGVVEFDGGFHFWYAVFGFASAVIALCTSRICPVLNSIARKMFRTLKLFLARGRKPDLMAGMTYRTIEELKGETITLIERNQDEEIVFTCASGRRFRMYHNQDCCESVAIGSVDGDILSIVGRAIIRAREEPGHEDGGKYESVTFTDFILATETSEVTIHWVGESNGYYSESVEFIELTK